MPFVASGCGVGVARRWPRNVSALPNNGFLFLSGRNLTVKQSPPCLAWGRLQKNSTFSFVSSQNGSGLTEILPFTSLSMMTHTGSLGAGGVGFRSIVISGFSFVSGMGISPLEMIEDTDESGTDRGK